MYDTLFDQLKTHPRLIVAEDYEIAQQVTEIKTQKFFNGSPIEEGSERLYWLSLRVLHRNRPGHAVLTSPQPERIQFLVEQALACAEASDAVPWFKFPLWRQRPETFSPAKGTEIDSCFSLIEEGANLNLAETIETWKTETTVFRRTEKNRIRYTQEGSRCHWNLVDSHSGIRLQEKFFPNGYEAVRLGKLRELIGLLGSASEESVSLQGVIGFSPRAMSSVLPTIADWFSSASVQSEKSPFNDEALTKENLGTGYSLFDDGRFEASWMSAPYDLEGSPTQKTTLIKNGTVSGFTYDTYTGTRANRLSTGNRVRSVFEEEPALGPNMLYIGPSEKKLADWWSENLDGVYIEGFISSQVSEQVFSAQAYGWEVRSGIPKRAIVFPVRTRLPDLMKKTLGVANDSVFFEGVGSPSIFFSEIPKVE